MSDLKHRFIFSLRQKLLTDDYGRWKNLDPTFLEDLCDRMGHEVEDFIQKEYEQLLENTAILLVRP